MNERAEREEVAVEESTLYRLGTIQLWHEMDQTGRHRLRAQAVPGLEVVGEWTDYTHVANVQIKDRKFIGVTGYGLLDNEDEQVAEITLLVRAP